MKNRAFTLIELLVVIAIIAVLASIALPVYRSVQEKAHGVQDMNNLRQIGLGFVSYLNDHDDTMFSSAANDNWALSLSGSNTTASNSYVPDMRSFLSPFDKNQSQRANPVSYGLNKFIYTPPPPATTTVTSYSHPSSLIVLGPNCTYTNNSLVFPGTTAANSIVSPGSVSGVMNSQQIMNVLFSDWHVATMKATDFNAGTGGTPIRRGIRARSCSNSSRNGGPGPPRPAILPGKGRSRIAPGVGTGGARPGPGFSLRRHFGCERPAALRSGRLCEFA